MTAHHREIEQSGTIDGLYYEVLQPGRGRGASGSSLASPLSPDTDPTRERLLLALPGFLSDGRQIKRLLREVGRRCIVVDPLGAGRSAGPTDAGEYAWSGQVRRLLAVLDAVSPGRVDLLGMSMGGMWAQQALLAAPGRFASVVLVASAARLNVRMRSILLGLRSLWVHGVPRLDVWRVLAPFLYSPDFLDRPSTVAMLEMLATDDRAHSAAAEAGRVLPLLQLESMLQHDALDRLTTLGPPAGVRAVIGGAADILMPASVQTELAGALSAGGRTIVPTILPGAGHTLWIERPTELAGHVRAALALAGGTGGGGQDAAGAAGDAPENR